VESKPRSWAWRGAARGSVTEVQLVAEAAHSGAGAGTEEDAALRGGADEASQNP
jgi:hypothetical protein